VYGSAFRGVSALKLPRNIGAIKIFDWCLAAFGDYNQPNLNWGDSAIQTHLVLS
jgi:hypothetical protein